MPTGKGALRIAIEDFLLDNPIKDFWAGIWEHLFERLEKDALAIYGKAIDQALAPFDADPQIRDAIVQAMSGSKQAGIASLLSFGSSIGSNLAGGFLAPFARSIQYGIEHKLHTARLDLATWVQLKWFYGDTLDMFKRDMLDIGWEETRLNSIENGLRPQFDVGDYIKLARRFPEYDSVARHRAEQKGWHKDAYDIMLKLTEVLPGANDLINMAVKEAYNDDAIARFNLDADLPIPARDDAEKQGLPPEWFRKYWIAHWQLPGANQVFEMLHRSNAGTGIPRTTDEDVKAYLKAADYSEFWRERLPFISYNPYTRVDTRRLFTKKIISEADVLKEYLAQGYDAEHAKNLTALTISMDEDGDKTLTRESITQGYNLGVIGRNDAKTTLQTLGYDETEAEYWLSLEDARKQKSMIEDELSITEFLYTEGSIDKNEAQTELDRLAIPADRKDGLMQEWDIKKRKKIKRLTKSEIEDLYQRALLDINQVQTEIMKLGYTSENTSMLVKVLDAKVSEEKQAKLITAQKEAERIKASATSTVYQKSAADIDLQIAELKLEQADLKLAYNSIEDEIVKLEIKTELDTIPEAIAKLNVAKAMAKKTSLNS